MTKLANRPNVEPTDEIRSERWRTMIFLKDGRSCISPKDFPSEHAATIVGRKNAARCVEEPRSLFSVYGVPGFFFLGSQYSHFIPIPWNGR